MITLNTVFTQTITNPDGKVITDINEGLKKYYPEIIDSITHNYESVSSYLCGDETKNYPDLVSYRIYGEEGYLYWFLISNFIENPFTEIKRGWTYSSYPDSVMSSAQATSLSSSKDSKYGAVITLN